MDGPLTVALYSTALFTITEGRAYSAAEYRAMLSKAGLEAGQIVTTGSCSGTDFVQPGTRVEATFPGIGAIATEIA